MTRALLLLLLVGLAPGCSCEGMEVQAAQPVPLGRVATLAEPARGTERVALLHGRLLPARRGKRMRLMGLVSDPALRSVSDAAAGARWRLSNNGIPKGSRQAAEGYWIGSEPSGNELRELYARGVRTVISGTRLPVAVRSTMQQLGMQHINLPFGSRFPDRRIVDRGVEGVLPGAIFIHCAHGADRSGALLAYLLRVRHGWTPQRALLSVALPDARNIAALRASLAQHGLVVSDADVAEVGGIYSAERNGHYGGLKAYEASYRRLIATTLAAMEEGAPFTLASAL